MSDLDDIVASAASPSKESAGSDLDDVVNSAVGEVSTAPRIEDTIKREGPKGTKRGKAFDRTLGSLYEAQRRTVPFLDKFLEPFVPPEEYLFAGPEQFKGKTFTPDEKTFSPFLESFGEPIASLPAQIATFKGIGAIGEAAKVTQAASALSKLGPVYSKLAPIAEKLGISVEQLVKSASKSAFEFGGFGTLQGAERGGVIGALEEGIPTSVFGAVLGPLTELGPMKKTFEAERQKRLPVKRIPTGDEMVAEYTRQQRLPVPITKTDLTTGDPRLAGAFKPATTLESSPSHPLPSERVSKPIQEKMSLFPTRSELIDREMQKRGLLNDHSEKILESSVREMGIPPDVSPSQVEGKSRINAVDSEIKRSEVELAPKTPLDLRVEPNDHAAISRLDKIAPILEKQDTPSMKEAFKQSGVDPQIVDEAFSKASAEGKTLERTASDALDEIVDNYKIRPGQTVIRKGGETSEFEIVRSPGDINDLQRMTWSGATMAWKRPELRPIIRAGDLAYKDGILARKTIDESFLQPLQKLPKQQRAILTEYQKGQEVLEALIPQENIDRLLADDRYELDFLTDRSNELSKLGASKEAQDLWLRATHAKIDAARFLRSKGINVKDPFHFHNHAWKGDTRVVQLFKDQNGKIVERTVAIGLDEEDAFSKLEPLAKASPKSTFVIKPRVEAPESLYAMDKTGGMKAYFTKLGQERRLKGGEFTKERGKFFSSLEQRRMNLGNYIEDPIEATAMYLNGIERKKILDKFSKEFFETKSKIDPNLRQIHQWLGGNEVDGTKSGFYGATHGSTQSIDKFMSEAFSSIGISPSRARSWMSKAYGFEVYSKIKYNYTGPIAHMMQSSINSASVLGPKWFLRGMKAFREFNEGEGPNIDLYRNILQETRANTQVFSPKIYSWAQKQRAKGILDPFWGFRFFSGRVNPITALGGYLKATEELKLSPEEAMDYAWNQMVRATPDVSPAALTPVARSQAFQLLFPFRHWIAKQVEFDLSLSKKEAGRLAAVSVGLTGLSTIPGWIPWVGPWARREKIRHPYLGRGSVGLLGQGWLSEHTNGWLHDNPLEIGLIFSDLAKAAKAPFSEQGRRELARTAVPKPVRQLYDLQQQLREGVARSGRTGEAITPITTAEALQGVVGTPTRVLQAYDISEESRNRPSTPVSEERKRRQEEMKQRIPKTQRMMKKMGRQERERIFGE